MKVVYRLRKAIFVLTFLFFFRTREINCKIYMQNRIPCVDLTASFENLHNVLIAYEDKTKLITFYTHLLDTIGYVFLKNHLHVPVQVISVSLVFV